MMRRSLIFVVLAMALAPQPSPAGEPIIFSDAGFTAEQKAGGLVVLETWASWCLPCKIQAPIIDRLRNSAEFRAMRILRVGEETPPDVWKRFRLTGYGMIVVFRDGKEVARGTPTSEKALLALLRGQS